MITKAELIRLLQDSEAPDDAIMDVSCAGPSVEGGERGDAMLANEEPFWLHIPFGPNKGDWLTLELDN